MTDKSIKAVTAIQAARLACSLGLSLVVQGGMASAAEVKFPKDKPEIAMDVPDGWAIDLLANEVEMRSPEKNSIIVASVLDRDREKVDVWSKQALERMKAFGVAFDPKAKAPPPPPPKVASISTNAFADKDDAFSFSGPPSLATPGTKGSNDQVDAGVNSLESLTGPEPDTTAPTKPKFRVVQYVGTTLNGKPVDVQFGVYTLPGERVLVVMQESAPEDERAVKIAKSVRVAN